MPMSSTMRNHKSPALPGQPGELRRMRSAASTLARGGRRGRPARAPSALTWRMCCRVGTGCEQPPLLLLVVGETGACRSLRAQRLRAAITNPRACASRSDQLQQCQLLRHQHSAGLELPCMFFSLRPRPSVRERATRKTCSICCSQAGLAVLRLENQGRCKRLCRTCAACRRDRRAARQRPRRRPVPARRVPWTKRCSLASTSASRRCLKNAGDAASCCVDPPDRQPRPGLYKRFAAVRPSPSRRNV